MKWLKFFKVDFVLSLILSFGFMIWSRIKWGKFVCGYPPQECAFKSWITQTAVMLIIIFVGIFILALVFNVIFGKKPFVHGVAIKKLGEKKITEEARTEAVKKMKFKPKKVIKI